MNDVQWNGRRWVPVLTDVTGAASVVRQLDWRQFVHHVAQAYRANRFEVTVTGDRSDDGVDLVASRKGQLWLVQCKHWRAYRVDVTAVRALHGRVAARAATGGVLLTTGYVDAETQEYADSVGVQLVGAQAIADLLGEGRLPGEMGTSRRARARSLPPPAATGQNPGPAPGTPASFDAQQQAFTAHLRPQARKRHRAALVLGIALPAAILGGVAAVTLQSGLLPVSSTPTAKAAAGPELASVAVGNRPVAIAVDTVAGRAYTANFDSGDVSVIDLAARAVVDIIDVPGRPSAVAVDTERNVLYVADYNGSRVHGISTRTGKETVTFKVAKQPDHLAVDPVRSRLFVTSGSSPNVQVFDTKAKKKRAAIKAEGAGPLAVDAAGHRLFAVARGGGCVFVHDLGSEGWERTCREEAALIGIAVDGERHRLYTLADEPVLTEVDLVAGTARERPTGAVARAIAIDPDRGVAYLVETAADRVVEVSLG
jgi:YVTN family beta-propeller protein